MVEWFFPHDVYLPCGKNHSTIQPFNHLIIFMKKILITGASGFVGSHLVEEALGRDMEVYAGIRKTSSRQYLKDGRIRFLEMDFSNKNELAKKLKANKFDYIVHNAGVVSVPKLEDYYRVNYEFSKNFIEAIYASKYIPNKFTYISSLASYGPASSDDLSDFLKEGHIRKPINTYGKSKLKTEEYLAQLNDFPYVVIRPGGVYGPREKEILTFFKLINKNIEGYIGSRDQHLAFIYVKDLARVIIDATVSPHMQKAYFVSDGKYYTQWDLGKYAKRILNKKTLRFHVPVGLVRSIAWLLEQPAKVTGKYPALNLEKVSILESMNWKCDISALKKDLNFEPEYDLEKGLEETLEWYKKNNWL
ncbi:MAG TPA: NAD(P)-dependent oxidoreductase [Bacteroidetes bacterium]|nr:NAD(P)-dependent oxidoreductase [Bacteroidota bacterium]